MSEANVTAANGRPRCTTRGCPVVYRDGVDRPCPLHVDEMAELAARMDATTAEFDAVMAAPAGRSAGEEMGQQRATTEGDNQTGHHPGAA